MIAIGAIPKRPKRRGALLLEVLLSIALLAGASAFALGAARSVFDALDRAKRQQEALDIARSKMGRPVQGFTSILRARPSLSTTQTPSPRSADPSGRKTARRMVRGV